MNRLATPAITGKAPRRSRAPFPHRSLRELQELGPEAFHILLDLAWRADEKRVAA